MKKKSILCVLGLCVSMLFSACGGNGSVHLVKLDGKTYDLTGDFQKVVGKMVQSDLIVADMQTLRCYDEDGCFLRGKDASLKLNSKSQPECFATQRPNNQINTEIIQNVYYFRNEYETAHGIKEDSKKKDIKALDGFVKYRGARQVNSDAYISMYIDNKPVNLDNYEDECDDILDVLEENPSKIQDIREEYFSDVQAIPSVCALFQSPNVIPYSNINDIQMRNHYLAIDIMIALASQDAAEALRDGEIDSYSLVWYSIENESVETYYYIYTYDDDWDNQKFMPKE